MIRGIGALVVSTYSQTLNVQTSRAYLIGSFEEKNWGTKWAFFGKRSRRCGMNRLGICGVKTFGLILDTKRVLLDMDSWTVAMEVGIR